ncbi:hypothetical protein B0F90DRAFT_1616749, partial [Multifurca ochricompacta]
LGFSNIPWPMFSIPSGIEDITQERVEEFMCYARRDSMQGVGQGRSIRWEMLRWHPDKFDRNVLDKVMECDREAVRTAAGIVARILTQI